MDVIDEFAPGDTSVVTMMGPDVESMVDGNLAVRLAKIGNEELADLCRDHRDHFIAAVGMLPTAVYGDCTDTLELGCRFLGADHVLYGTDFPSMTPEELPRTIASVENLPISQAEQEQIFYRNALDLLHLA